MELPGPDYPAPAKLNLFLHVIGRRDLLAEWGRRHGLRPEWIQPERRRSVAHYDVFGEFAERLIDRLTRPDAMR